MRVAVGLALLVAVGNIVQVAFGTKVKFGSTHTSVPGVALFSVIMLVCAIGMWQRRYWALLGFEALLAIVIVAFCFVLVTAVDVLRAVIAAGGDRRRRLPVLQARARAQPPADADCAGRLTRLGAAGPQACTCGREMQAFG